jgi:hypothetical protein
VSCAYLFIRSRHGIEDARRRSDFAAKFSPIVSESTSTHEFGAQSLCTTFSNAVESAAGSYVHPASESGDFIVLNGWVAGNDLSKEPFATSVASWISERIRRDSFDEFVRNTTGEWSVLSIAASGDISAAISWPGGEHLYYGCLDGVLVISNRALLCAAALHQNLPTPNPFFLGWLLTENRAFLSDDGTPFPHVHALHPLKYLHVKRGSTAYELHERPWPRHSELRSYDQLLEEMARRVEVLHRLPEVPFRFSLTGGRDSRLVLAALVKANCFDKLRSCYLIAAEDHPDVIIGKLLASHYGVPFECFSREASTRSVWEDLEIHQFQTELGVHFWDSKGILERPREGRMGGAYGEMFFSHFKWYQYFGWTGVAGILESNGFIDPDGVMTNQAREHFRQGFRQFWQKRRDEGLPPSQIRDRLHRDGRMWRWVGQGRLAVNLGSINTNPIPSPEMLDKYLAITYPERRDGRIHYELMHRADPWLPEQPFAGKGFSRTLTGHAQRKMKFPPVKRTPAPQMTLWQTQRRELSQYLLSPSKGNFFDLIEKSRLEKLLKRTGPNAARRRIASILGILGVRFALDEPIRPRPCKVEGT